MENNASASTQPAEADAPWKPRTSLPADRKRVFKTVIGILNEMTPQTFDIQEERLLNSGINSADILQGVAIIVYDKTISETQLFPMYAKLCGNLAKVAPQFPPDEPNGLIISFTRILLNICQEAFEDASELNTGTESSTTPEQAVESNSKLRVLRNIRLIGELFNQKVIPGKIVHHCIQGLLGSHENTAPPDQNVEALWVLFKTAGKQLEESTKSGMIIDKYFVRLKELSTSPNLVWRIKFMIRDVLDWRENKWIPIQKEVNEINVEMERRLGLRPSNSNIQNGHGASATGRNIFSTSRGKPRAIISAPRSVRRTRYGPLVRSDFKSGMKSEGLLPSAGLIPYTDRPQMTIPTSPAINPNLPPQDLLLSRKTSSSAYYGGSTQPGPAIPVSQEPKKDGLVAPIPAASPMSPAELHNKSKSLLEEYFYIGDLEEAMQCVVELQSTEYHSEFVQQAISLAFDHSQRHLELVGQLLQSLHSQKVLSYKSLRNGFLLIAEQCDDLVIDIPFAPKLLGELVGRIVLAGASDLRLLADVIEKVKMVEMRRTTFEKT